ncbi:MAG TPA: toll/interleukin-1 receptor domain-containing protein [Bryobacteraceae bacterium]|nr:toll/interleukin-1 receptor domain-containing protein [Bryobacteraceae bacterium]
MGSLVFCYASEDAAVVRELADYIEQNLAFTVSLDECVVRPGFDLVDAAERALSAEVALVVLSPASVPATWKRDKWEPVFFKERAELGSQLAFLLVGECRFPELFRKQRFFDLSDGLVPIARRLKHWLLRPIGPADREPGLPSLLSDLRVSIADRPGNAFDIPYEDARQFAAACEADFERVLRFNFQDRSRPGMIGDIGHALGLQLPGTVGENRATLVRHCAEHRYLFLFERLRTEDRELVDFGGRTSIIFSADAPERARHSPDEIAAAYFTAPRDEETCMKLLGSACSYMAELLGPDFDAGLRLGWGLVTVLRSAHRFAETIEVLAAMEKAARDRGDAWALHKIEREQSWVSDDSSPDGTVCILPTAAPDLAQLSLFN